MGFYPQYSPAARAVCKHAEHSHHYDSGWKLICDNCGEILKDSLRKTHGPPTQDQKEAWHRRISNQIKQSKGG